MSAVIAGGTDLFGEEEQRRAERLRCLEEQRMLLGALQEDVWAALHALTASAASHWRSASARRCAGQREELAAEVRQVACAVDDALAAVTRAVDALRWED